MTAPAETLRIDALRSAPLDSWVALSEDETRVIAVADTYEDKVKATDDLGVSDPIVLKTPKSWLPFSV